jgi:FAD/FMN-containing dehydrogenase
MIYPSLVCHAGESNFHLLIPYNPNNEQEKKDLWDLYDRLVDRLNFF